MHLRTALPLLLLAAPLAAQTPTEARAIAVATADHTAYTLPPGKLVLAESLLHSGIALHFISIAWGILVLWFLLQSRLAHRMRNVANNISKNRWIQGFTFSLLLLIADTLLMLPLELYSKHRLHAYGLSVQTWPSWTQDFLVSNLLLLVFGGLSVMGLFYLIRKFPRRWWIPAWLAFCFISVLGFFVTPYVIDPLFNHFEPLAKTNPALVQQLERVVARAGEHIPPERMFLMQASSKTTQLNAYVTGVGASKRIVVWDTSLKKGTQDEVLFIFGHELGHYALGHILYGLFMTFLVAFVVFALAFYLFQWLLARFGERWRIPRQDNWAALVVFLLALSLVMILEEPVQNILVRRTEHAADVYGEEVIQGIVPDPQHSAQAAFQLLGEGSLNAPDPPPAYVFWTFSHPSIPFRAAFARAYNPYAPGEQPKYFKK